MSFRNLDFVHFIHHYNHCIHPQSCQEHLVLVNLLLVLNGKEVLVQ